MSSTSRVLVALAASAMFLSGCSALPEAGGSTEAMAGYSEPAWMTEARQQREEDTARIGSCMKEAGWELEMLPDGGFADGDTLLSPEQADLMMASLEECGEKVYGTEEAEVTAAEWGVRYDHALDTRDCLVAQGFEVEDPPSRDAYVDAGIAGASGLWIPFSSVIDQINDGLVSMTGDEFFDLFNTCEQDGVSMGIVME